MTMRFTNIVKAQITQGLVKTLFERAGYRVTRLGVEELFTEVTHLDEQQYKDLNLPLGLRYLPDLLVADQELSHAYLLEVKFRSTFDEASMKSLYFELQRQKQYWPDTYAVLLVADSFVQNGRFHQDYIRVIPPSHTEALNLLGKATTDDQRGYRSFYEHKGCEGIWDYLPMLTIFDSFRHTAQTAVNARNADTITATIRDLKKL